MKNPKILGTSKIGARGQVTIPKRARIEFELNPGDIILFIKKDKNLIIKKEL